MYQTLISVADLAALSASQAPVIVDCRFDLQDPSAGRRAFESGHIPGAVYADLDKDLSGPPVTDRGRHPMPSPERLVSVFAALGIDNDSQVVAYDDSHGMIAARLWWMLRYLEHFDVAVLDGGWQAWQRAGLPEAAGASTPVPGAFTGNARRDRLVTIDAISAEDDLVDARARERYTGATEPLDPRAGHIPGARNHHFAANVDRDGCFLPPAALKQSFIDTLGTLPTEATVHYCGSGVSACHNVLAQVHAGLAEPRLYGGSWSEWCADPARPAATGE